MHTPPTPTTQRPRQLERETKRLPANGILYRPGYPPLFGASITEYGTNVGSPFCISL